jgi:nicotinate-nucleotide adenylyltransferase
LANKIAIFGGSFNPIHTGHLKVALHAVSECSLSRVIFLPNANPPHKQGFDMVSACHRYNMVSLAIEGHECFDISDYEMNRSGPSYTIDTMGEMKKRFKEQLSFIIGADSLYTLHKWKSFDRLIAECSFIVADRTCNEGNSLKTAADKINSMGGDVTLISMPKIDVTSTMIRDMLSRGKDVTGLLPERVHDYICKNNLYKSNPEDER